jgi:hypothetical protein
MPTKPRRKGRGSPLKRTIKVPTLRTSTLRGR